MSISKEAIEAAAAEICDWDNQYAWKSLGAESPMKASYEDAAERSLTAAAPYIQAAALRDAAEYAVANIAIWDGNATLTDVSTEASYEDTASWLRARADQLEGETE